jgi:2-C-methyl-D-erythritol 4-phosphate cytidylyltransferase / 2-C-methyl-D-erythritol 2,4-cyclodiphosphate synthase
MRIAAVLVAAGTGTRFGADTPKQFHPLAGRPVIRHAAETLLAHAELLQPVGDREPITHALTSLATLPPVPGGVTRQDSVRAGLEALVVHAPEVVLVHDAARPYIPPGTIAGLLSALQTAPGAIPALAVADTLKRVATNRITSTVPRDGLYRAQTPQAFHFPSLLRAHRSGSTAATDDAALLEAIGEPVVIVPGSEDNIKITYPEDFMRLERILSARLTPRTGTGFDVHAVDPGRPLVLCGIRIPHEQGLAGHSDADVGIHALCDAIYGALAEGDIGRHFPPTDTTWKDADSARFLIHAADRIAARQGILGNADVTLICERPKISPHGDAMRQRLADLLRTTPDRISVKATTTERLGFTGRGEGIAAQAVATILLPWNGLPS